CDTKIDLHSLDRKEAVDIRVIERLDAHDVRPGRESGNLELAALTQRETADERTRPGIERHYMRALNSAAVAHDAAAHGTGICAEVAVGIEVRHAGDVVGLQLTIRYRAAAEQDRKHHGAGRKHPAIVPCLQLRFTDCGMSESEQVP